jgi:Not1 N-terminal domain, CCR4-Not complex component
MKTKAFSKEGLGQSAKQDPRERARSEIRDWLNTTVDTLNLQVRHLCTIPGQHAGMEWRWSPISHTIKAGSHIQ